MSNEQTLEEAAFRAVEAVRAAIEAARKYNDFGSVLGAQDEASEIHNHILLDLGRAATRARRLKRRIELWDSGKREVDLLNGGAG